MFLRHYGLREQPFGVTPDPRFLFSTRVHQEALASLQYGVQEGRGFVALIAAPGMGKTTLLFQLLEQLRKTTRTAFLFNTQCDSVQMLSSLLAELEFDPKQTGERAPANAAERAKDTDLLTLQESLNRLLLAESGAGRTPVVVIDEAQNLSEPVMETIRLLSDFETPSAKLMQIVLAGQTELGERLAMPQLSQLRQRISIVCRLAALDAADVAPYIEVRMRAAGYTGVAPVFTPQAYAKIAELSGGIPRNINNICFHALSLGCAQGLRRIDLDVLDEVATDLNWGNFSKQAATPEQRSSAANRVERPAAHSFARRVASPYRTATPAHMSHARPVPAEVHAVPVTARVATAPAFRPAALPRTTEPPRSTPEQRPAPVSSAPPPASTHVPAPHPASSATKVQPVAQPAPPKQPARQLAPQAAPQRSPQHAYGIPLLVFLIILIAGLAWILWNNPAILSLLHGSNIRAEAPASARLMEGNATVNQTLLLHSGVAAGSTSGDIGKGSDDDDAQDDVRWIKPLARRTAAPRSKK